MRNPHAGQPFTATDDEIAEALLDVSIPTLMLSLVHMSGDPSLIRGDLKPAGLFLNEVQGYMSEEDKAAFVQGRLEAPLAGLAKDKRVVRLQNRREVERFVTVH